MHNNDESGLNCLGKALSLSLTSFRLVKQLSQHHPWSSIFGHNFGMQRNFESLKTPDQFALAFCGRPNQSDVTVVVTIDVIARDRADIPREGRKPSSLHPDRPTAPGH